MYEYELELIYDEYGWVEIEGKSECKKISLKKTAQFHNWDDLDAFLGGYVDAFGKITVTIKAKEVTLDG